MEQFSFQVSTKVVFGARSVTDVGSEAAVINAKHVMIVTDPEIVNAGLVHKVTEALELAKIACWMDVPLSTHARSMNKPLLNYSS